MTCGPAVDAAVVVVVVADEAAAVEDRVAVVVPRAVAVARPGARDLAAAELRAVPRLARHRCLARRVVRR
jgi:hypothetical protein